MGGYVYIVADRARLAASAPVDYITVWQPLYDEEGNVDPETGGNWELLNAPVLDFMNT